MFPANQTTWLSSYAPQKRMSAASEDATQDLCWPEKTIPARFAASVTSFADAIAVTDSESSVTYRQLDEQSNRLANAIAACRIAPNSNVGVMVDHSTSIPIGILGVLKAGHAYVPLDPRLPMKRLETIASNSEISVIVSAGSCLSKALALSPSYEIISLSELASHPSHILNVCDDGGPKPLARAYILHTSGTTGRPKGVAQNHENAVYYANTYSNSLKISHNDRLTLFSSFAFDAAVMDILGALLSGARLCLYDLRAIGLSGIYSWLTKESISVWHSTPTVFRAVCAASERRFPDTVRSVVLGGETATLVDFEYFKKKCGRGADFVNGLGPSEATVALQYFANHETILSTATVPVGFPVGTAEVVLLGDPLLGAQIGICDRHLADGYWNQAELTAEKFPPHPSNDGRRIFLTGDLGRLTDADGIEFLGRSDSQVKIRGVRIEPTEIEIAIVKFGLVAECAVVAVGEETKRLICYFVRKMGARVVIDDMRHHLSKELPETMIPSAFVEVPSLPRALNGKLDVSLLPSPPRRPEAASVNPTTPLEAELCEIWAKVLEVPQVGIHDDFFELGGDSLLAVVTIAEMSERYGDFLQLTDFFAEPRISSLASFISSMQIDKSAPIQRGKGDEQSGS